MLSFSLCYQCTKSFSILNVGQSYFEGITKIGVFKQVKSILQFGHRICIYHKIASSCSSALHTRGLFLRSQPSKGNLQLEKHTVTASYEQWLHKCYLQSQAVVNSAYEWYGRLQEDPELEKHFGNSWEHSVSMYSSSTHSSILRIRQSPIH